jgi:hypothetical protein
VKILAGILYLLSLCFSLPAVWTTIKIANPTYLWAYTVALVLACIAIMLSLFED